MPALNMPLGYLAAEPDELGNCFEFTLGKARELTNMHKVSDIHCRHLIDQAVGKETRSNPAYCTYVCRRRRTLPFGVIHI